MLSVLTTTVIHWLRNSFAVMIVASVLCPNGVADDYIYLGYRHDEDATEDGVSYALVPVKSLAPRSGFIFKRWTDENGRQVKRVQGQFRIAKDTDGKTVLRVFLDDSRNESELGYLVPTSDDTHGRVIVFHGKRRVGDEYKPYNLLLKYEKPDKSFAAFLAGFTSGIKDADDAAAIEILKIWAGGK